MVPTSRKFTQEDLQFLTSYIDVSVRKSMEQLLEPIRELLTRNDKAIRGNGKDGLIVDVEVLSEKVTMFIALQSEFNKEQRKINESFLAAEKLLEALGKINSEGGGNKKGEEPENKPGSWYDFRNSTLIPIVVSTAMIVIGAIIEHVITK